MEAHLDEFVTRHFDRVEPLPKSDIPRSKFHETYVKYCINNGEKVLQKKYVMEYITGKLYTTKTRGVYVVRGLQLKQ